MKATVLSRVIAKLIDIAFLMALAVIVPFPAGPLLALLYSLAADSMNFAGFSGQSLGKRIVGLRAVHTLSRRPAGLRESVLRNAPVAVAVFFALIPVWGWLIAILVGLPLMLLEIYLMATVASGHRLGDVMGDSEVIAVVSRKRAARVSEAAGNEPSVG